VKRSSVGTRFKDEEHLLVQRVIPKTYIAAGISGVVAVVTTIAAIVKCIVEAAP
jgi:hypothetical protein